MRELRDTHLIFRLTGDYALWAILLAIAYHYVPDLYRQLPIGVIENLISQEGGPTGFIGVQIHASRVNTEFGGFLWLTTAILGAVAVMLPVSVFAMRSNRPPARSSFSWP